MPQVLLPGQEPLSLEGYLDLERSQALTSLEGEEGPSRAPPSSEAQVCGEGGRVCMYAPDEMR